MPVTPPPVEIEAVVVSPPRLPALPGQAAFAVQRLGVEDLAGAPRLDEALRRSPGVSLFRRTGSDAANPTIQGLSLRAFAPSGAGRALVTLDGAPQNDPFGGWVIWSALPPEALSGATIIRGAGAGPYGAGALTGVVALEERGAGEGLQAFDVSVGSRESGRAAVAFGSPSLLITAVGSTTAGYSPVRGAQQGRADRPTDLHDYAVSGRYQRDMGPARAALRLGIYEERRGAGLAGARSIASGGSAALTVARAPQDGARGWRVQAWARTSDLANSSVAVATGRATTTPANDQYSTPAFGWGLNAALQGRGETLSWEVGADARFTDGVDNERFRVVNGLFTRGREAGGKSAVGGLYAETSLERQDLTLTGGLRLDAWSNSDAVRRERDLATGAVLLDQSSSGDSGTTPTARLGLRYRLGEGLWLRGAAYSGFRAPSLNELHRPFRVGNDITEANPGLQPETLYGAEAGLSGEGARPWNLTVFYNELHDPITNVTVGAGPATFPTAGFVPAGGVLRQRRNAGAIEAWGLEADVAWPVSPALALRGALAATRARVDGGSAVPQLTGKRPAQTPEVTLTGGVDWRPVSALQVNLDLRYESARFEDDLNVRRLAPSTRVDARFGWRLAADTEVYLSAENLLDARIAVGQTADSVTSYAAPRIVRIGLSIQR